MKLGSIVVKHIWKSIITAQLLLLSYSVSAGVISYAGYTRETSSYIVTGGGLEWLQWTETLDLSVIDPSLEPSSFLQRMQQLYSQGWRIAVEDEVKNLMTNFFGSPNEYAVGLLGYENASVSALQNFINLFGNTGVWCCSPEAFGTFEHGQVYVKKAESNAPELDATYAWLDTNTPGRIGDFAQGIILVRSVPESSQNVLLIIGFSVMLIFHGSSLGRRNNHEL